MVDYNAEKSANIISRVRADDAQWPAGAMLFGPSGGKEIVIDREFEDDVFVARCNDAADAARLCRARDAARDLADQLEAAGVEIERLETEARRGTNEIDRNIQGLFDVTAERDSLAAEVKRLRESWGVSRNQLVDEGGSLRQQLETMKNERDRAGAATAAAQREIAALNEAIADLATVRMGQRKSITAARAALKCGDGELMVDAALRVRALAEQRLEDLAAEHRNRAVSEMEAAETLATAQRRIADLETRVATGEEDIAHLTKVRRETHMILTENKGNGLEVRATARARMADLAVAQQRITELESGGHYHAMRCALNDRLEGERDAALATLATLRAIAPVFQAAGSALGNLRHGPGGRGGPGECDVGCVKCSVSTARAALTPELLGVLGRVTAPVLSALSEDEAYTLSALVNDDRRDWSTAGSPIIIKLLRFHGFTGGK